MFIMDNRLKMLVTACPPPKKKKNTPTNVVPSYGSKFYFEGLYILKIQMPVGSFDKIVMKLWL